MANKLSDLFVKLGLNSSSFNKGIDGAQKKTNAFGNGLKKIGGLIAGAFAVTAIVSFGKELVMLGGVAEGVRSAFNRMAEDNTMADLKKATAGTVSELELMKRAVSAKNLGLPIKDLANLFEFATKRAQETGESVDFLVNSIVTGIGRKSPLILDNLGISAIELRKQLKGVGFESAQVSDIAAAVGRIAAESMAESGKIIDTNAIKVASLGAKWDDLKLKIAETPLVINKVSDSINLLDKALTVLESEHLSFWEKINIFQSQDKTFDEAQKRLNEYNELTKKTIPELNKLLEVETKRLKLLGESGGDLDVYIESAKAVTRLRESIEKINKERQESIKHIDEESTAFRNQIEEERTLSEEQANRIQLIGELKTETDKLKESIDLFNTSQGAELQATLKQIKANEELIKQLTTLRSIREEAPARITTIDEIPQIGLPFVSEEALQLNEDVLAAMVTQIKSFSAEYLDEWEQLRQGMEGMITGGIIAVADEFGQAIETIIGSIQTGDLKMKSIGASMLKTIGSFLGDFGKMLIAYGIAQEAFWTSLGLGPIGAGVAIAAGIALVAIGGAISGVGQKVSKGNLSTGGGAGGASGGGFNPGGTQAEDNRVVFELEGTKLIGVMQNTNRRRGIIA